MAEKISTRHATAAVASAQLGDVIPLVRDVGGTPATGTATLQQVASLIAANTALGGLSNVDLTTVAPQTDDALLFDGVNWVPGQVATSGGSGTTLYAGAWEKIETKEVAGASEIVVDIPSGYTLVEFIVITNLGTSSGLRAQFSQDGGATFLNGASDYYRAGHYAINSNVDGSAFTATSDHMSLAAGNLGASATRRTFARFTTTEPHVTGTNKRFDGVSHYVADTNNAEVTHNANELIANANPVDAVRIFPSAGNFDCKVIVLGLKSSDGHQINEARGARLELQGDTSWAANSALDWGGSTAVQFDTDGFFETGSPSLPTRLTIPSGKGIKKVRLTAMVHVSGSYGTGFTYGFEIFKNGARGVSNGWVRGDEISGAVIDSGLIEVSDGDYFEVYSQTSSTKTAQADRAFFSIEVVEQIKPSEPVLHVRDEKPSGTDGGSSSAATWNVRDLNTVKTNTISGASLASNQITLPAGSYRIEARAPNVSVSRNQLRLRDVTNTTTLAVGVNDYSTPTNATGNVTVLVADITLATSVTCELQHYTEDARASTGLGSDVSSGEVEVYADVFIRKLS